MREVPPALGSGPSTLNFDLGSQPNIPLAAYGVQAGPRPPQASSNAPVALDKTLPSPASDDATEYGSFDGPARRRRGAPVGFVLGALAVLGLVVGGLALRGPGEPPRPAASVAPPKVTPPPVVVREAEPGDALQVDAGVPEAERAPVKAPRPALSAPAPAPAWQAPPPKAPRDRKLGDVGHTDEF
jgi:Meckel syndrome type 1 protein